MIHKPAFCSLLIIKLNSNYYKIQPGIKKPALFLGGMMNLMNIIKISTAIGFFLDWP